VRVNNATNVEPVRPKLYQARGAATRAGFASYIGQSSLRRKRAEVLADW
jgi:hypothetical protein